MSRNTPKAECKCEETIIICPVCGQIPASRVIVYNESLRKQSFDISPILPTCDICKSEVEFMGCTQGGTIILLNGTCGSGKSTIADELVKTHGFLAIDADCAMQVVRHKLGVKHVDFDSKELFDEISKEIDILSAFGEKIVLAHVVMPDDIPKYKALFESKGMAYRIILLKPSYEVAVERTRTRTCHAGVTPEEWVRYFYTKLTFSTDVEIIDSSNITAEQTAWRIIWPLLGIATDSELTPSKPFHGTT